MESHEIDQKLVELGLSVKSVFIPWSQSRNKNEKNPSLNWSVTLVKNGKDILTTDYSAGMGHCPSYNKIRKSPFSSIKNWDMQHYIIPECEKGFPVKNVLESVGQIVHNNKKPILPDSKDVIYSLLLDSEAMDYSSFESWANSFGYDEDSRSAEKIYNECMKIALKFRQIGEDTISQLRKIFQDY